MLAGTRYYLHGKVTENNNCDIIILHSFLFRVYLQSCSVYSNFIVIIVVIANVSPNTVSSLYNVNIYIYIYMYIAQWLQK